MQYRVPPKDPDVLFRAALVYNHFGDTDHMLELLQKAFALAPRQIGCEIRQILITCELTRVSGYAPQA